MAITTTCSNCKALFRLDEDMAGRTVRCQKCSHIFVVALSQPLPTNTAAETTKPEESASPASNAPPPAPPPMTHPAWDDAETPTHADAEEDRRSPPRRRDDDEDDRDRRRHDDDERDDDRGPPRRRYDDDEDDLDARDRDARPKPPGMSTTAWVLLIGGITFVLLLCLGGGIGLILWLALRDPNNPAPADFPPGGTNVLFGKDKTFRSDSRLVAADLRDPMIGKATKAYTVHMVAGDSYQIDMRSQHFDCYLFLVDIERKEMIADDDDSGGYPYARIMIRAPRTGFYRIHCTYFEDPRYPPIGDFMLVVRRTADGRFVPPPPPPPGPGLRPLLRKRF